MRGHLLDTNVLSESAKSTPHPAVKKFVAEHQDLWVSVIVIEEIQRGVELMPLGHRRNGLADWLARTLEAFEGRFLTVGLREAQQSGKFRARAKRRGYELSHADALIAATAVSHDLCLATRNVKDFRVLEIPTHNPWEPA